VPFGWQRTRRSQLATPPSILSEVPSLQENTAILGSFPSALPGRGSNFYTYSDGVDLN
jgi:hypothetical protein